MTVSYTHLEKTIMIEPQIKGEAQKIVKNNEDANEPILQLNKIINHLLEDINDKKANAGQVITVIDILCEKMKDDYRIEMQFEKVLVTFIASALIMCDITDEQRNKLVEEWIKRVKKIFSNQSYVAEVNMVIDVYKRQIQISVYEDKIYIWNDGEMPPNLDSTDKLFMKHSSKPFNPKLANVFFKSGMIEACLLYTSNHGKMSI